MATTEGNSQDVTVTAHVEATGPIDLERSESELLTSGDHPVGERHDVVEVPISELRLGLSARSRGENPEHVRTLAENFSRLPPIVVHRQTMIVIDGYHRRRAALELGLDRIPVVFFEGSPADAYLESVRLNVSHGRPLTLAERERAAGRIAAENAEWSDRRIADVCGLSPKTVRRLRGASLTEDSPRLMLGRDEKRRPVDPAGARLRVAEYIRARPDASLQEVAQATGSSVATVRDVRNRVRNEQDVVPEGLKRRKAPSVPDDAALLHHDKASPVVPSEASATSGGKDFVRWFASRDIRDHHWQPYLDSIPPSQVQAYAAEARRRAMSWRAFAESLERRPGP